MRDPANVRIHPILILSPELYLLTMYVWGNVKIGCIRRNALAESETSVGDI